MRRKFLCLFIVLLVVVSNMNFAFASDQPPNNEVQTTLNNIDDTQKKEKIVDLCSLGYVTFSSEPAKNIKIKSEEDVIKEIKYLSHMSDAELDNYIAEKIAETIKTVKESPNTFFTDNAYHILEKYNFTNDIDTLKKSNIILEEIGNPVMTGEQLDNLALAVEPEIKYTKTAYGTCNYYLFGVIGGMNVKVTWYVSNGGSGAITRFSRAVSGYGSNYAEWGGHQLNSSGIYNAGQRANINLTGFFYLTLLPIVEDLTADIWFYNDGGFDPM